jgi:hypothetical protein
MTFPCCRREDGGKEAWTARFGPGQTGLGKSAADAGPRGNACLSGLALETTSLIDNCVLRDAGGLVMLAGAKRVYGRG